MENGWPGRMEEPKSLGYITRYLHDNFTAEVGMKRTSTGEKEYPTSKLRVCGYLGEITYPERCIVSLWRRSCKEPYSTLADGRNCEMRTPQEPQNSRPFILTILHDLVTAKSEEEQEAKQKKIDRKDRDALLKVRRLMIVEVELLI